MEAIILIDTLPIEGIINNLSNNFGTFIVLPGKKVKYAHYYYSKP